MHYHTFLDYIQMQGCFWVRGFNTSFGAFYHNNQSMKTAFLKEYDWVPWPAAILFCKDAGIDIPPELEDKLPEFDELGLME